MKIRLDKSGKRSWLAIVGAAGIVLMTAYVMVQQLNRLSTYDVPVALNQSVAYKLDNGIEPSSAMPDTKSSLSDMIPFAIIAEPQRNIEATSISGDIARLLPPNGSFDYAKTHGQNRFTWEPEPGIRLATIITPYNNGDKFIVTGQSLSEAESRIKVITSLMLFAGLGIVIWTTLALGLKRR